ncbi:hypothetical protein MKZ38_000019 [Zalerion maritima]|uniref:Cation diffusion facilitator 1 n=1 Tax=Zalerion maritima TaxID=339359 RepID=A0AAD5WMR6_9PEZI|nr:hypothetical protein MKZ38_000019 [Zalerion maritima]
MDPNLSHTITHHPHVFDIEPSPPSRQHTPRPSNSAPPIHLEPIRTDFSNNGTSSAFEPLTPPADGAPASEAVSRAPRESMADVESQTTATARLSPDSDPYNLRAAYKTESEIEDIKANTGRKRHTASLPERKNSVSSYQRGGRKGIIKGCLPAKGQDKLSAKRVETFYESQNATIERMLTSVEEHRAAAKSSRGDDALRFKIAVWGSFGANVVLSGLQLYAAISSGSLSLFATMADAIFDPMSNLTLILASRAVIHVDPSRFPSGKARLETVGNIVFCFLMVAVSAVIIAFSARDLNVADEGPDGLKKFNLPSVIAVCTAFATKFALFCYCWALRNKYSQVRILWQDHRNDLFVNGFGILTSVGGSRLAWWIDPVGAILLSVFVSMIWLRTAFEEFLLLVGVVASVETQQLITYLCLTHEPGAIKAVDTVRVYHSGPRLIAEVDVVMDVDKSLGETHDVAEALQVKLERLPDIERAYVHVDYETTHKPEHYFKKDL